MTQRPLHSGKGEPSTRKIKQLQINMHRKISVLNFIRQTVLNMKGHTSPNTVMVSDFHTPLLLKGHPHCPLLPERIERETWAKLHHRANRLTCQQNIPSDYRTHSSWWNILPNRYFGPKQIQKKRNNFLYLIRLDHNRKKLAISKKYPT